MTQPVRWTPFTNPLHRLIQLADFIAAVLHRYRKLTVHLESARTNTQQCQSGNGSFLEWQLQMQVLEPLARFGPTTTDVAACLANRALVHCGAESRQVVERLRPVVDALLQAVRKPASWLGPYRNEQRYREQGSVLEEYRECRRDLFTAAARDRHDLPEAVECRTTMIFFENVDRGSGVVTATLTGWRDEALGDLVRTEEWPTGADETPVSDPDGTVYPTPDLDLPEGFHLGVHRQRRCLIWESAAGRQTWRCDGAIAYGDMPDPIRRALGVSSWPAALFPVNRSAACLRRWGEYCRDTAHWLLQPGALTSRPDFDWLAMLSAMRELCAAVGVPGCNAVVAGVQLPRDQVLGLSELAALGVTLVAFADRPHAAADVVVPPPPPATVLSCPFVFAREGDGYFIRAFGAEGHFRATAGFRDLDMILRFPGKGVYLIELDSGGNDGALQSRSKQPALDGQARSMIERDIERLRGEVEDADNEVERADSQARLDELLGFVRSATGIGGRVRDLNNLYEKIRPKIAKRLRAAFTALRDATPSLERLADHLEASVKCETPKYIYLPEPPLVWAFQVGR